MAAGEIFNSFIERLSQAAASEEAAAAESVRIGKKLTAGDFAAKLREVISRQHLSLIGTLDSFMMRIVRMIPLELGLEGEVSVMSDYRSPVERMRLLGEMMMRESEDARSIFRQAFRLALGSAGARSFLERFSSFVVAWHARYRDLCENGAGPSAWGCPGTVWAGAQAPLDLEVSIAEIRALAQKLSVHAGRRGADRFIDAVANFPGAVPSLPKCMEDDPVAADALAKMNAWKIALALKETQGVFLLMSAYESAYASKVRAKGLVTFDDLPRLLNSLPAGVKLPLEYRMDAQFDHWALDEFQDTSRGQWRALENLIGEASAPGSGKSVFIVGDRKQSIYEWRGGDVEILGRQVARAETDGNLLETLDESYRYVPVISGAVNRIFGENAVRGALDMDDAPESAKWKCRDHVSHDSDGAGFVQVVQAEKAGRTAAISDFFEPIENALAAVKPWERGISTAILVRKNSAGEAILAHLKAHGVKNVVFEGDSAVADCPVLSAMIELVRLAEHSADGFAYAHIRHSPVGEALFPDGVPAPADLSAALLADFTRMGMVRKFREVREALKTVPGTWNGFAESRFGDFIKCAAEFEEIRDATMRLSDFADFIMHKTRRDFAEAGMVRIMTMHQSKGLGFDWVIIPFYEPEKMVAERHTGPLVHAGPDWVMVNPGPSVALSDAVLARAERERRHVQVYNSLCLNYVAMTRAKKALTMILHPENAKPPPVPEKFSDLVRLTGLETSGDPQWYAGAGSGGGKKSQVPGRPDFVRSPRRTVRKSRPSESFYSGLRGDALFGDDFGKAARRGSEAHARYERIEWLDAGQARNGFERALVRPHDALSLWREKGYELFVDGKWESGRFDRVVFTGTEAERRATICDFKTNAMRAGESEGEFAARMRETYAPQMDAYRRALAHLTGIPLERIEAKLLLEAAGMAVAV
jgi:superfamily I DNA/RNA helicase